MRNVFDLVNVNIEEGVTRKMAPVDSGQVASCIVSASYKISDIISYHISYMTWIN